MSLDSDFDPEKLSSGIRAVARGLLREIRNAMYEEALLVERDAKENCPVAPNGQRAGELRASIRTLKPVNEGEYLIIRIVCGGPGIDYALAVHEHLSEHSPESWRAAEESGDGVHFNVGGPKFLERAVLDHRPTYSENVMRRIDVNRAARG